MKQKASLKAHFFKNKFKEIFLMPRVQNEGYNMTLETLAQDEDNMVILIDAARVS